MNPSPSAVEFEFLKEYDTAPTPIGPSHFVSCAGSSASGSGTPLTVLTLCPAPDSIGCPPVTPHPLMTTHTIFAPTGATMSPPPLGSPPAASPVGPPPAASPVGSPLTALSTGSPPVGSPPPAALYVGSPPAAFQPNGTLPRALL
ncbi:classical arabinogalactan protein 9-like [Phragmites australis]|uniref:classical arabinogalactan protein 9-like n=1 Tax=Phragmites australis TaxID=29695 RepID=UPI002D7A1DDC|nr:classical arabinogalactan protein 9-like [Phragmites australis]